MCLLVAGVGVVGGVCVVTHTGRLPVCWDCCLAVAGGLHAVARVERTALGRRSGLVGGQVLPVRVLVSAQGFGCQMRYYSGYLALWLGFGIDSQFVKVLECLFWG